MVYAKFFLLIRHIKYTIHLVSITPVLRYETNLTITKNNRLITIKLS